MVAGLSRHDPGVAATMAKAAARANTGPSWLGSSLIEPIKQFFDSQAALLKALVYVLAALSGLVYFWVLLLLLNINAFDYLVLSDLYLIGLQTLFVGLLTVLVALSVAVSLLIVGAILIAIVFIGIFIVGAAAPFLGVGGLQLLQKGRVQTLSLAGVVLSSLDRAALASASAANNLARTLSKRDGGAPPPIVEEISDPKKRWIPGAVDFLDRRQRGIEIPRLDKRKWRRLRRKWTNKVVKSAKANWAVVRSLPAQAVWMAILVLICIGSAVIAGVDLLRIKGSTGWFDRVASTVCSKEFPDVLMTGVVPIASTEKYVFLYRREEAASFILERAQVGHMRVPVGSASSKVSCAGTSEVAKAPPGLDKFATHDELKAWALPVSASIAAANTQLAAIKSELEAARPSLAASAQKLGAVDADMRQLTALVSDLDVRERVKSVADALGRHAEALERLEKELHQRLAKIAANLEDGAVVRELSTLRTVVTDNALPRLERAIGGLHDPAKVPSLSAIEVELRALRHAVDALPKPNPSAELHLIIKNVATLEGRITEIRNYILASLSPAGPGCLSAEKLIGSFYFDHNSDKLDRVQEEGRSPRAHLNELYKEIDKRMQRMDPLHLMSSWIVIVGNASAVGRTSYNFDLADKRAESIRDDMKLQKLFAGRTSVIRVVSRGEVFHLPQSDPDGEIARRVDIFDCLKKRG